MIALLLTQLVAPAHAGDPCPIDFRVSNLGPLSKPGSVEIENDAVFKALVKHIASRDCTDPAIIKADNGTLPLEAGGKGTLQTWRLQELLVDDKGAFRCDDAHVALAALSATPESGHVIYQRGTRRVLLTTAGWQTTCVEISTLESGGDKAIGALWEGATSKVVQDRHDNP